jgi:hypothetical protein
MTTKTKTFRHHAKALWLRVVCEAHVCDACQRRKFDGRGYGLLPERQVRAAPWGEVCVDLIVGPWTCKVNGKVYEFNALTCIDPVTNLTEIIQVDRKTSSHISSRFPLNWPSRYPCPGRHIHDNGGEFTGWEFQRLLRLILSIIDVVATTSCNPTANAICERMHQTVGNILCTLVYTAPLGTVEQARDLVDDGGSIHGSVCSTSICVGFVEHFPGCCRGVLPVLSYAQFFANNT